ncbi:MAG: septum formation inhibitor Maf [Thauera sp.]|nr:septum formation inhibitor Maf [Thauera sp.]
MPMKLVLASTSAYRKMLLERLHLPFDTDRPETDETPLPGEAPAATAERLAAEKARAVAGRWPDALVIGSDQVAHLGDEVFGKPGTEARAIAQLQRMRGQTVVFHTALAVLNTRTGHLQVEVIPTQVRFRNLSDDEIRRYVAKEQPLDCAGSAKSEGLGITLLDAMPGEDPTALIGLPLIALSRMLRAEGLELP